MKIHEKEKVIKFLDWLIEDIENVEYFNIKDFINKYKDISEHEKSYLPYSIESIGKTYELFENTLNSEDWFKLTEKGIELKEYGKGFNAFEKKLKSKPLDLYKIIPIVLSVIFFALNFYQKNNYDDLKNQYDSLKIEYDSCKQKLSDLNNKMIANKEKPLLDTLKTKNLSDLKTD